MTTISGQCCAEVRVNSLHQLALLMPPSVVSYELIVGADPILTHHADPNVTQGGALRF
jgi:hypothetical protein